MLIPFGDDVERTKVPMCVISLIIVNVLVAAYELRLVQDAATDPNALKDFFLMFGLVPNAVPGGSFVGLFSYMFLHGGFMHLFGNMLVLWAFGPTLEEFLGAGRFLLVYLVTGLTAAALHLAFSWGSDIPLVGASGAIAGVIGMYGIAVGPDTRIKTWLFFFFRGFVIKVPTVVYAVFWLYTQWSGFMSSDSDRHVGGVAFACHVGGFFGGMLLYPFVKNQNRRLVDHGFGEKRIHDVCEDARTDAEVQLAAARSPILQKCSDCGCELSDQHEIAPDLYRCPTIGCARLNMKASALPPGPRNRFSTAMADLS